MVIEAGVKQDSLFFVHLGHHQFDVVQGSDVVAFLEPQASQRRVVCGIGPLFADGRKADRHPPPVQFGDDAESELGVGMTDPALSNDVFHENCLWPD